MKTIIKLKVSTSTFVLAIFVISMILIYTESLISQSGIWAYKTPYAPYFKYYQNSGILYINLTSFLIDILIFIFLLFKLIAHSQKNIGLFCCLIIGSFLTWLELWYGSTFYYGEVRDKQGLPFTTNNFGIVGSIIFSTYFLLNMEKLKNQKVLIQIIFIIFNVIIHLLVAEILKEPWNYVSS